MITNFPLVSLKALTAIYICIMSACFSFGSPAQAKGKAVQSEVQISTQDGVATAIFHTTTGGRVSAFFPLNVEQNEAEIGGTVERQLPPSPPGDTAQLSAEAAGEISGIVSIKPHRKLEVPALLCPPDKTNFLCPPSDDGTYDITYKPLKGSSCTQTVHAPAPVPPAQPSDTARVPQLTCSNGNFFVVMQSIETNPGNNTCLIGGTKATLRAFSKAGAVFKVPGATRVAPGAHSVVAARGNRMTVSQTHVAEVKMICVPNHLRPGQPCQVTTTVVCPNIHEVKDGTLSIKNYNPDVLNMPDKVIPIENDPKSIAPSTDELVKRDEKNMIKNIKQRLVNAPQNAETTRMIDTLNQLNDRLGQ